MLASCTSEAGFGGALEDCATTATRVEGGFRLSGRKIFFTESDVATHFTTCARHEHPALGPQMLFFNGVSIETPGLVVHRTWDTLGMRATQSNDLELADAFVPEEALFHAYPVGHLDGGIGLSVMSLNVPSFGAIALGIAFAGIGRGWESVNWMFVALGAASAALGAVRLALFVRRHPLPSEGA